MFKNKKYFFMSAKRPRPAVPVLVHVDNPAEVGSVTVDTSSIEGKMDTVITNQNRIYDKIPTSAGDGGGSADLTTVNEKTTALATAVGPADATTGDRNLNGAVRNLVGSIGDFNASVSPSGGTVKAFLNNIRDGIGDVTKAPSTSGSTVRDLLYILKGSIGPINSASSDTNIIGCVRNLRVAVGASGSQLLPTGDSVRSFLLNLCKAVGNSYETPTATQNTIRGLLTAIKENTASGGSGGSADLTTVNEKTTALAAAIGSASDDSSTVSVIGLLKSITDKY